MRSLVLLPEALVVGAAVLLLLAGRLGGVPGPLRGNLPAIATGVVLVALIVELWLGAVLLSVGAAIAVADWSAEDSASTPIALTLLAGFGVMVAASAGDFVGLWAGLELAAAAAVVLVGRRRPD